MVLSPKEYERLVLKEQMNAYFKDKVSTISQKRGSIQDSAQRDLLPELYVNSKFFTSVFGGNEIDVSGNAKVAPLDGVDETFFELTDIDRQILQMIDNGESFDSISKAIGKGGVNIRLASQLTGYEIDVQREGVEDDVELTEFSDEIEAWVINEFKNIGLDTARSVLDLELSELVKRTDLEEETILEVQRILKEEFES